tara:strand:- start:327 stop:545 length:219 start_codon:yes stop_codon:yes gene_type:complete
VDKNNQRRKTMLNKELTQEIDKAFEDFYDQLDRNLFGLYINPSPLRPKDDVKTGRKFKEQEEEEPKELDFSY